MSGLNDTPRRPMPQAVISPLPGSAELRRRIIPTQNQPQHPQVGVGPPGLMTPTIKPANPLSTIPFQSNKIINPSSIGFRK